MSILTLLRQLRLRTFVRSFTHGSGERQLQFVMVAFLGLVAFGGIFGFSLVAFTAMTWTGSSARETGAIVTAIVYQAAAVALVFFGLATAVHTMYLSTDLRLLLSMPIRDRTIFAYKFWELLIGDAGVFLVLGLPILLAWGIAASASPLYYAALLLVTPLVLVLPAGLSLLLMIPLMRLLPAGRAREIIAALSVLAGLGLWSAAQVFTHQGTGTGALRGLDSLQQSPIPHVPPGGWAADTLLGAAFLDWGHFFRGLVPLAGTSLAVYACCLVVARWGYATGWARASESGRRVRYGGWARHIFGWLPQDLRAVVVKDLTSFPRDLRQLAGAGSVAIMGTVLALLNRTPEDLHELGSFVGLAPYLTGAGFAAMTTLQFAFGSIGGEGRTYWLYIMAPISTRRLLLAKGLAAFCLGAAAVVLGVSAVSVFNYSTPGLLAGIAAGTLLSAVMAAYAIGIAAIFPRFNWENPKQAVTTAGGFAIIFVLVWLVIVTLLAVVFLFLLNTFLAFWMALLVAVLAWLLGAGGPGIALAAAGSKHLEALEWEL